MDKTQKHAQAVADKSAQEIMEYLSEEFKGRAAIASSFGAEDMVLIDMCSKLKTRIDIFTLDTGRLPQETYDVMDEAAKKYSIKFCVFEPDTKELEELETKKGPNSFYESIDNRKECCRIRKIAPLKRALSGNDCWITGLRREQAVTRGSLEVIEWDEGNNMIKANPLASWSEKQVWDYIKANNVPYNKLHDKGYPSIGCAPCTRAVKPGEDLRAGRWWWETPEQKECGLHVKDGRLVRKNVGKS